MEKRNQLRLLLLVVFGLATVRAGAMENQTKVEENKEEKKEIVVEEKKIELEEEKKTEEKKEITTETPKEEKKVEENNEKKVEEKKTEENNDEKVEEKKTEENNDEKVEEKKTEENNDEKVKENNEEEDNDKVEEDNDENNNEEENNKEETKDRANLLNASINTGLKALLSAITGFIIGNINNRAISIPATFATSWCFDGIGNPLAMDRAKALITGAGFFGLTLGRYAKNRTFIKTAAQQLVRVFTKKTASPLGNTQNITDPNIPVQLVQK